MLNHPKLTPEHTDALTKQGFEFDPETQGAHLLFFTSAEDGYMFDLFNINGTLIAFHQRWFHSGQGVEVEPIWEGEREPDEIIDAVKALFSEKNAFDIVEYHANLAPLRLVA